MSWNNVKSSIQNSIKQNGSGAITGNLLQGVLLTICNEAALGTGPQGKSAYQVWLDEGNVGTVSDFFASIKGDTGDNICLRKTTTGIEWKLSSQPDTDHQLLITIDELKLHFSDLTVADIAELKKPATDAADALTIYVQQKELILTQLEQDTESARQDAITATINANNATSAATIATSSANQATIDANNAKTVADQAAIEAKSAENAATIAATSANNAANLANQATTNANNATLNATTTATKAEELNANQPKIVTGEWWVYNLATHTYVNTGLPARGSEGKGPIVLPNGNYGNWDEDSEEYIDSGIEASATSDIENAIVNFTESDTRENLQTGEKVPTLFGKLKKWFNDLGTLAWKSKIDYASDIDNLPDLATTTFVNNAISNHNTSNTAHSDIREELTNLANISLFKHTEELPASGEANKIYIIPNPASENDENKYLEYYWNVNESKWEMLGSTGGGSEAGGITNPNYEIVTISPQSNHVNIEHEFIDNVQIEVLWDSIVQRQWTFNGSPMTLYIPKDKKYTIRVSDLNWFNTPDPLVYTAEGGNTRTATPTYTCAEINVTFSDYGRQLSAEFSSMMDGATLTVSLNGKEKELYFQGYNNPSTLYAPIGSKLTFIGTATLADLFVPVTRTLQVTGGKIAFLYQYESGGINVNAYSNNESFTYTFSILDANTNEILFANMESTSQRGKFIPLRVGRRIIIRFGAVEGYKIPEDSQITVPLGNEHVSGYYRGIYLQIRKNLMKEVIATIYNNTDNIIYNTVTIPAEYSSSQHMNVRVKEGLNYRVEFSDISGYDTPPPITGTAIEENTSIMVNYGGSIFTLHNNNNTIIHVKLYNTDTDEVYFDNDISQWHTTEIVIPVNTSYSLLATYGDENILEEEGISKSGSKYVTLQKRTYFVRIQHQQDYMATYLLTNLDTNEVIEKELQRYQNTDIELPNNTNYKVELKPFQGFGLPEPYIGKAVFPDNNNAQYYQNISLAYDAVQLNIQSYTSYGQLPKRIFTLINRDTNEVYKTFTMHAGESNSSEIIPKNFNYEIRAGKIPNFSTPSPYQGNSGSSSNHSINMQYGYYFIYGQNTNSFDVNVKIINTDTEEQLHAFVISSYNYSQYFPIRPGVNYRIEFGDVEGYQKPSSITGIATVNNTYYLSNSNMMYS